MISRRPTRPLPSRNGWIVSNCTCASAGAHQRRQAVVVGVQEPLERRHAVGHRGVRRRNEGGVPGPGAADPVLRAAELARGPCRCRGPARAARRGSRGSAGSRAGNPRAAARARGRAPRRSSRPPRRRRAARRAPRRARTAAGRRATTACPRSARRAPPPCGRTCRGRATCRAAGWRRRRAGRARGPRPRDDAGVAVHAERRDRGQRRRHEGADGLASGRAHFVSAAVTSFHCQIPRRSNLE